jgi:propanediol dehydratase small subunit
LGVHRGRESLDANTLAEAISATFTRRGMAVPTDVPTGLSDEFAADPSRQTLWSAFMRTHDLAMTPLADVVTSIRTALEPAIGLAARTPKS